MWRITSIIAVMGGEGHGRIMSIYWALMMPGTNTASLDPLNNTSGEVCYSPSFTEEKWGVWRGSVSYWALEDSHLVFSLPWQSQPVWSPTQGQAVHLSHSSFALFSLFLCTETTDPLKAKFLFPLCDGRESRRNWGSTGWILLKHVCINETSSVGCGSETAYILGSEKGRRGHYLNFFSIFISQVSVSTYVKSVLQVIFQHSRTQ